MLGLALVAGLLVYSGVYNVSATEQHLWPTYWTIRAAMVRAVEVRARRIDVPALDDAARSRGFVVYCDHCARCHGAPGVAPEPFALGLLPVPENLTLVARERSAAELYWIVKNGLKMTGMPAWQYRLEEGAMWDVVAFVKTLPALSPADYAALKPARAKEEGSAPATPDPERGKKAVQQYACVTCHEIPGVVGSNSPVGPSLKQLARRQVIAGILPNTAENIARWISAPQKLKPGNAMPDLGVRVRDANDIAAFLATLD